MVNLVVILRVKNVVRLDSILKNSTLGDLLGLEALVLLEVLAVVVSQVVVTHDGGESDSGADQVVAHHGLEAGLAGFKVGTSDKGALLLGVLDDTWVESVLRASIKIKDLLFNSSHSEKNRGWERHIPVNHALQVAH